MQKTQSNECTAEGGGLSLRDKVRSHDGPADDIIVSEVVEATYGFTVGLVKPVARVGQSEMPEFGAGEYPAKDFPKWEIEIIKRTKANMACPACAATGTLANSGVAGRLNQGGFRLAQLKCLATKEGCGKKMRVVEALIAGGLADEAKQYELSLDHAKKQKRTSPPMTAQREKTIPFAMKRQRMEDNVVMERADADVVPTNTGPHKGPTTEQGMDLPTTAVMVETNTQEEGNGASTNDSVRPPGPVCEPVHQTSSRMDRLEREVMELKDMIRLLVALGLG